MLLRWLRVLSVTSPEHACPHLQHDLESENADRLLNDLRAQLLAAAVIVDAEEMQRIEVAACDDIDGVRDRDSNKLSVTASVFIEAEKHVRRYPSVAADTGTSIRTAQVYIYIYLPPADKKRVATRNSHPRHGIH